jgi:hypothetical protein
MNYQKFTYHLISTLRLQDKVKALVKNIIIYGCVFGCEKMMGKFPLNKSFCYIVILWQTTTILKYIAIDNQIVHTCTNLTT